VLSISNGFISLDDGRTLRYNEKIFNLTYLNIVKYFTEFHRGLCPPLVLVSYAVEFKFFKLAPSHHKPLPSFVQLPACLLVFPSFDEKHGARFW